MDLDLDYPHYQHSALTRFSTLATAYCALFERPSAVSGQNLLRQILVLLPQLYAAALALPSPHVLFDKPESPSSGVDEEAPTHPLEEPPDPDREFLETHVAAHYALARYLGGLDSYREIYDPYGPDSDEEVRGSLIDDLSDIHRELLSGLRKWTRGETGAALWEWRFGFEIHWGEHATGALRALHARCSTYDLPWPTADDGSA